MLQMHSRWWTGSDPLPAVRGRFAYAPGDNRATGQLYAAGEQSWPDSLAEVGPALLVALRRDVGVDLPIVIFQAYRDGAGCGWHQDTPFDSQAVLSLGATRSFGVRPVGGVPVWTRVGHGDLVVMPSGFQTQWEHCVPVDRSIRERVSLVFRTPVRN